MLRLFGKSTIAQVIVLLAAMALMWARPLANALPMAPAAGYAPLYNLIYAPGLHPIVAVITAMLLILIGGFALNLMLVRTSLTPQNNLMPCLLYCLFMSATATTLSPMLLANLITLVIMHLLLLRSTLLSIPHDKIFGTAALISIASMLYLPMLTLLIAYLLVAVNYRLYSWRDWIVLLLGLLAPYLLLWAYHFIVGDLQECFTLTAEGLSDLGVRTGRMPLLPMIATVLLIAVLTVSLFNFWHHLGEKTVAWQKNAVTVVMPFVAGLAVLFYSHLFPVNLQFFAAPFALSGTLLFAAPSRHYGCQRRPWHTWGLEILLVLMLIAAFIC